MKMKNKDIDMNNYQDTGIDQTDINASENDGSIVSVESVYLSNIKELERANWISGCLETAVFSNISELYSTIDELNQHYEYLTDFGNRSFHQPEYHGIDLSKQVEMLRGHILQHSLIVIIDEFENKIVDYAVISKGTKNTCLTEDGKYSIVDLFKKHRFKDYLTVVEMHNHPRVVVARPSVADREVHFLLKHVCNFFSYRLGDNFIVTDYDIYSSLQDNSEDTSEYQ